METIVMDDGTRLRGEVVGTGDAILLVHGLGGAALDFRGHLEWLSEHGTVIAVDLRGHGESDHPTEESSYGLGRFVRDLRNVVAAVGQPLRAVIGHSMGGIVVQRAVLAGDLQPEALVLFSTCPGPLPGLPKPMAVAGAEILRRDGLDAFRRVMEKIDPLGTPASRHYKELHPEYPGIQEWRWQHTSPAMYAAMLVELTKIVDVSPQLRGVDLPCAVIVGDQDAPFLEPTAQIADALPNSTYTVIPDAGHHPQLHQPAAWSAAVRNGLGFD